MRVFITLIAFLLLRKVHPALVVGLVVAVGDKFGYGGELVACGTYCIYNLRQSLGSILCSVVHKDDAAVLQL